MIERSPILLGHNEEIERGTFQVFRIDGKEIDEYIECDDLAFMADGSMAEDLFGISIIREIVSGGGQALVVKHPLDELKGLV